MLKGFKVYMLGHNSIYQNPIYCIHKSDFSPAIARRVMNLSLSYLKMSVLSLYVKKFRIKCCLRFNPNSSAVTATSHSSVKVTQNKC